VVDVLACAQIECMTRLREEARKRRQ
jgi:hypothetical protein